MCGIFGFAGTGREDYRAALLLQELAKTDEIRGRHSTGLVIQACDGACYVKKDVGTGTDYVASGHTRWLFKHRIAAALAHNRLATTGEITKRNAHPFCQKVNGKWAFGVHNGIIGNHEKLCEEFGVAKPDVDSEAVFRAIARMRREGASIPDAVEEVTYYISPRADFAFAYLDQESRELYLWRSHERPLVIFDARRINLGRWFCSTEEIFRDPWLSIKGPLGLLKSVSHFETVPYRLYMVKAGRRSSLEVEIVRELRRQPCSYAEPVQGSIFCDHDYNDQQYGFDDGPVMDDLIEDLPSEREASSGKSRGGFASRNWERDRKF